MGRTAVGAFRPSQAKNGDLRRPLEDERKARPSLFQPNGVSYELDEIQQLLYLILNKVQLLFTTRSVKE